MLVLFLIHAVFNCAFWWFHAVVLQRSAKHWQWANIYNAHALCLSLFQSQGQRARSPESASSLTERLEQANSALTSSLSLRLYSGMSRYVCHWFFEVKGKAQYKWSRNIRILLSYRYRHLWTCPCRFSQQRFLGEFRWLFLAQFAHLARVAKASLIIQA